MQFKFQKYQATGNDFVMIDNRDDNQSEQDKRSIVRCVCHRRFGIGADGVIFIEHSQSADFLLDYFNSDTTKSFCGNGTRAAYQFVKDNNMISKNEVSFQAYDGLHSACFYENMIKISMKTVHNYQLENGYAVINTGSPHYITESKDLETLDVVYEARKIRYSDMFSKEGVNVNFITQKQGDIHLRTYERGVEAETYSCGTAATAVAIYASLKQLTDNQPINIKTKGGELKVDLKISSGVYSDIYLIGPSKHVFSGEIRI